MNLFCILVIYALIGINEAATKPVCEQRIPNFEKFIKKKKNIKKFFFFQFHFQNDWCYGPYLKQEMDACVATYGATQGKFLGILAQFPGK